MENINFEKRNLIFQKKSIFVVFLSFIFLLFTYGCTKTVREKKLVSYSALQHYSLGLYYQQKNEDSLATNEFEQAVIQEPENHEFLSELAFSLSKIDNLKEAEKYAKLALKYGSTDKNLYIILGNGAKERDEKKIAVSFYKKALSDTSNYFLIINLAQLMRELNEMDDAIELLRALKTRYPFDLRIHTQLADIFGRVEKFDLAKREFNEALVIDSLYYPAILGLGIIYEIIGDIDSSLIFYRKASQVNPNNINMLKRIVEFNIIKGGWDEARDNALTILNLSPVENTVRKQLAYALFRLQDVEGSLEQYLLLSGLIPDDMSVHHFLGRLYYKKNEMEKAREQFKRSLSLNPEFIPNIEYLYLIALKEGDDEKEDYFFHELLQKGVKTENLFFSIGMNFYTEQDYSMAKSFLMKCVKENPKFPNPFYTLGFVYDKLGVLDSAELSYRKVIELDSMNANAYNALGYLFVEHAVKLDEAEKLIKRALEIDPLNGYYIDSLGWLYYKQGGFDRAKELLLEALGQTEDPVIYDHLGDVYEKLGNEEEARKMWDKALELDPENEEVKKKLE